MDHPGEIFFMAITIGSNSSQGEGVSTMMLRPANVLLAWLDSAVDAHLSMQGSLDAYLQVSGYCFPKCLISQPFCGLKSCSKPQLLDIGHLPNGSNQSAPVCVKLWFISLLLTWGSRQ